MSLTIEKDFDKTVLNVIKYKNSWIFVVKTKRSSLKNLAVFQGLINQKAFDFVLISWNMQYFRDICIDFILSYKHLQEIKVAVGGAYQINMQVVSLSLMRITCRNR